MSRKPTLYWWSPARIPKSLMVEAAKNSAAWSYLLRHGARRVSNFGDALNPLVFEALTGKRPRWASARRAEFAAVGSVIETLIKADSRAVVIGAGLKDGHTLDALSNRLDLRAVRGRLSASALDLPGVAGIGDPGLVIGEMLGSRRGHRPRSGVLLVPHFAVPQLPGSRAVLSGARARGAEIVLPNEHPLEVATRIARSDLVITSSLHALVFADALGVPAHRVTFRAGAGEPEFKYRDYESIFELEGEAAPIGDWLSTDSSAAVRRKAEVRKEIVAASLPHVLSKIHSAFAAVA